MDKNERAIRCYERAGFRRTGFQENVYRSTTGDFWGNIEMAINHNQ